MKGHLQVATVPAAVNGNGKECLGCRALGGGGEEGGYQNEVQTWCVLRMPCEGCPCGTCRDRRFMRTTNSAHEEMEAHL